MKRNSKFYIMQVFDDDANKCKWTLRTKLLIIIGTVYSVCAKCPFSVLQ